MLALRGEYEEIARANARLHDGLERLDERLERLANG